MKTLRSRLVASYSVIVTLTVGVTMIVGFMLVSRQLLTGTDFLLDAEYEEISPKLIGLTPPFTAQTVERAIGEHTRIDGPFYFFQVHDRGNGILFRSSNLAGKSLPDLTELKLDRASVSLGDLGTLRVCEYRNGPLDVQIASSLNYLSGLSRRFYRTLLLALPAVLLFGVAISYLLCELTLRPLRLIERTARRISASNLSERIPIMAEDEIGRLADLLNEMFERLEKSFDKVKQFTADFSHELRTPLSMVALHTEKVLKKPGLDAESLAALEELLTETKRLNQIIDQLLTVAKAEAHVLPLTLATNSTAQFIAEFAEDGSTLAEATGRKFVVQRNEPLTATFDASWVRHVLFNLLSNALKFTPPDGVIELESLREGDHWRVTLSDEGPGIPPEHTATIFERFTQLNRGSQGPAGNGLGLVVSKSIIELHGGQIYAEAAPSDGARITFRLPLTKTPA